MVFTSNPSFLNSQEVVFHIKGFFIGVKFVTLTIYRALLCTLPRLFAFFTRKEPFFETCGIDLGEATHCTAPVT